MRSPPSDWMAVFDRARERERELGKPAFALDRLAWQWTCGEWARWHRSRAAAGVCAGCGAPLGKRAAQKMLGGDAIHESADCLRLFADKWQDEAERALMALGLERPDPVGEA